MQGSVAFISLPLFFYIIEGLGVALGAAVKETFGYINAILGVFLDEVVLGVENKQNQGYAKKQDPKCCFYHALSILKKRRINQRCLGMGSCQV